MLTSTLFQTTRPTPAPPKWSRWLLVAILIAGAALRFWGLGDIGLHREDEDTSALPVMHILEDGSPRFPSGMYYARAYAHSYLMAGSVQVFGKSEWALRLPSALCGVLLIVLAWRLGQRFLKPAWNLVFAACIAFLPSLILASQTARMYIFLLASLAGFAILVFRWERTNKLSDFFAAMAVMLIALQFHTLAVFGAFLLFYPGLLHGDIRRLIWACLGFAATLYGYDAVNDWLGQHFPQSTITNFVDRPEPAGPTAAALVPQLSMWTKVLAALVAAAVAAVAVRTVKSGWMKLAVGALVFAGLAAQLLLAWHLAALLLIVALVIALRHDAKWLPLLLTLSVTTLAIAAMQMSRLHGAGIGSLKNIIGAMVGMPSVWTYARVADYSLFALLACAGAMAVGLWRLALRRPLPDFLLMLLLWGWIPLLAVGMFVWSPPPRYTVVTLLPMLLAAVAGLQWLGERMSRDKTPATATAIATALIATLLLVNPVALARSYHAGYRLHPDHVGAAQFVLSQHPAPVDIIVAEDAIVQRYYLPRVDYWLMARASIVDFVRRGADGVVRDIYTNSLNIGNGAELQALIDRQDRGAIYIIGSGENQEDGRRLMRGPELNARLTSDEFPVVYEGRDGLTKVWKIPAPGRDQ